LAQNRIKLLGHSFDESQVYIVCKHIMAEAEVVEIAHDHDEVIQLMCASTVHGVDDASPVCANDVKSLMPDSAADIVLPPEHYASLEAGQWIIRPYPD
jgi:hypothetical protein